MVWTPSRLCSQWVLGRSGSSGERAPEVRVVFLNMCTFVLHQGVLRHPGGMSRVNPDLKGVGPGKVVPQPGSHPQMFESQRRGWNIYQSNKGCLKELYIASIAVPKEEAHPNLFQRRKSCENTVLDSEQRSRF